MRYNTKMAWRRGARASLNGSGHQRATALRRVAPRRGISNGAALAFRSMAGSRTRRAAEQRRGSNSWRAAAAQTRRAHSSSITIA
jgi:hypothetical protein